MSAAYSVITNTRRVVYKVSGAQPVTQYGGPKIDPQHLVLNIDVLDDSFRLNLEGPTYRADGKLGSRLGYAFFNQAKDAPGWVNDIVKAEGLTWAVFDDE